MNVLDVTLKKIDIEFPKWQKFIDITTTNERMLTDEKPVFHPGTIKDTVSLIIRFPINTPACCHKKVLAHCSNPDKVANNVHYSA